MMVPDTSDGWKRWFLRFSASIVLLSPLFGNALAHGGGLRSAAAGTLAVPTWLFLLTGGGVVGASFLLASLITDRALIYNIHHARTLVSVPVAKFASPVARTVGVATLVAVVVIGFFGPVDPLQNAAILIVWVGWWAGFTISVYLFGNTWPVFNPWRTLAELLPGGSVASYPEKLGAWPSVVGLLVLVWVEVVSPLADQSRVLAVTVLAYTLLTLVGAFVYGTDRWFSTVDPVARVFRYYGRIAPIQLTDDGFELGFPGSATRTMEHPAGGRGAVAFVIALLWATTFDGFVLTPFWRTAAQALVGVGLPPLFVYFTALFGGFAVFYGAYLGASRLSRRTAETYRTSNAIALLFLPSLLPIAAGYHLAHFLGYFVSLSPALVAALVSPVSPSLFATVSLPGWFGALELSFVLLGHLAGIWIAHATAFDIFPGRLQAIRSQYPFVLAMVLYTMTSLWILSQPSVTPPYI